MEHFTTQPIRLSKLYEILLERSGNQHWWPADSADEMIVGAILTQSVAWVNVEKALNNLRLEGIRTLEDIHATAEDKLAVLIRPTLYFNQKAAKLKAMAQLIKTECWFDLTKLFSQEPLVLRNKLMALKGLGPETVDSILLYAAGMPVFVIDSYTDRLLWRLGHRPAQRSYPAWQEYIVSRLPSDVPLFKDFHAQIVNQCKNYCTKVPRCGICPLSEKCLEQKLPK